jgi:dihydroceramidase
MLFHGTLQNWAQQTDELPMVWHLLTCLYCINRDNIDKQSGDKWRDLAPLLLFVYAIAFSTMHLKYNTTTIFQVHYVSLLAVVLGTMYNRFKNVEIGSSAKHIIKLFSISGLCGGACWLIDYLGCAWVSKLPINPQGHMFWHLFMGYAAYCSVTMLKILEAAQANEGFQIFYWLGLPFVKNDCDLPIVKSDLIMGADAKPSSAKYLF